MGKQNSPQLGKFLLLKEKVWPEDQWEIASFFSGAASLGLGVFILRSSHVIPYHRGPHCRAGCQGCEDTSE